MRQVRLVRARVERLPDGAEIKSALRAEVDDALDLPEPPASHAALIAAVLELLRDSKLTTDEALKVKAAFLDGG